MLVILGALAFDRYASHVRTDADDPWWWTEGGGIPAEVAGSGPIVGLDGDRLQSRVMPPGMLALTFNDGPDPQWTPAILDVLARHGARATFFVTGAQVNAYPDLIRRIVLEGHELGVQPFTHRELSAMPAWQRRLELSFTQNAIAGVTGTRTILLRPPGATRTDAIAPGEVAALTEAAEMGYVLVFADRDTLDWRQPGVDAIVAVAAPPVVPADEPPPGVVVTLHDGGGDRAQTVAALDEALGRLAPAGYQFVTVGEGLRLPDDPEASRWSVASGLTLGWAQDGAHALTSATRALVAIALGLAGLRLLIQLTGAMLHARRRRPWLQSDLGPVSVVVPTFNEAKTIKSTLTSLVASGYPEIEVLVVDDGSTDRTAAIVRRLALPNVRLISQPNLGKSAALNNGIAHATSDLLVMIDADTVLNPDAIGRLVEPFLDPSVGAVSGNTKVANRDGLIGGLQHLEYVAGFNLDRRIFDVGQCMPSVPGAIGAFRRSAIESAGGLSAVTLAEDTDLTMAVAAAGWRVVYEDAAIAWTEAPESWLDLWRQRRRWCYGTMQAMWKHRRAFIGRGAAGRLGRRGLAYILLFQVLTPLFGPVVDTYAFFCALTGAWGALAAFWLGLIGAQAAAAVCAFRLDRERYRGLWTLLVHHTVYRPLLYLVVIQSTVTAWLGNEQRWHRPAPG
jgi:cellulose synthase/poly-beta-1,6-N-acetylglucosamine synthase-like glycosyltransferase/peptidoglycan/xylan/chitin deacetylase (PgdA/CDA1 family)